MIFPFRRHKLKVFVAVLITANAAWIYNSYNVQVEVKIARSEYTSSEWKEKASNEESFGNTSNLQEGHELKPTVCRPSQTLVGALKIDFKEMNSSFFQLNRTYWEINQSRPVFEPNHCLPKTTVAIIIPFRDREEHLRLLLGHLHPILKRQLARYQIFVVEQIGNSTFNKGRVMNTGFQFAKENFGISFDCFIFHDVDMLPENDLNIYECNAAAVSHLSCSLNKFDYHPLCCGMTVGGVLAFTGDQYIKVNGFPNHYWGWGGEDNDINTRIQMNNLKVQRPLVNTCRYFMIEHERDALNPYVPSKVNNRVSSARDFASANGLNSLNSSVIKYERLPLYVHVLVDVGTPDYEL